MTKPVRLQLSRKKGFNLQDHSRAVNGLEAVNVARPSIFGNPVKVTEDCPAKEAVRIYRGLLKTFSQKKIMDMVVYGDNGEPAPVHGLGFLVWRRKVLDRLPKLKGKNLACWCPPGEPCHADVLLKLANKES